MKELESKTELKRIINEPSKIISNIKLSLILPMKKLEIKDKVFINCIFDKQTLEDCRFLNVHFIKCSFNDTTFNDVAFDYVMMTKSSLVGADLRNLDLTKVRFTGCDLTNADMSFSEISNEDSPYGIDDCCFNRTNLEAAKVTHNQIVNCDFTKAKLVDSNLSSTEFIYYDLVAEKAFRNTEDFYETKHGSLAAIDAKTYNYVKKSKANLHNATVTITDPYMVQNEPLPCAFL